VTTEPMMQINPVDMNMPLGINLAVDANTPVDANLLPQSSGDMPQVPDISPAPLLPDGLSKDSDANVSVE